MRAVRGSAWLRPGHRGREKEAGGGQQGGRWRARVPASVGHTPSSFCPRRETTEGSGGARRAGPPPGWAGLLLLGYAGEGRPR